jgi:serine/threonine protein kinase
MQKSDLSLVSDKNIARMILRKSLESLWFLNYHRLIHRDIKPANLMLDRECNFKVIDYGNMKLVGKEEKLSSFLGTPLYIAPEVIRGQ